uniref:Uncharacterized protein n=1 Tax=Coturnix japonica TaxID=93934 RepID=A0A8C2TVI3_COTJA
MLRWAVHLEGGPRRVNHAAVAVGHKVYSFGGYCSGEDYETLAGKAPSVRCCPWVRTVLDMSTEWEMD